MSGRELDAAGIHEPALRRSYAACRALNARHGKTFYLAALMLPAWKRPYVHALYGFARYADELVDDLTAPVPAAARATRFDTFRDEILGYLRTETAPVGRSPVGTDPVALAITDTAARWQLPVAHFEAFLTSMRRDLTVTGYDTYAELADYMHGSAAVVGLQMLPILGHPGVPAAEVEPYAQQLGVAFQLANIIRDVGEDLRRDRVYLPAEDLARFGVTREHLAAGVVDDPVRELLRFEIARCRDLLRSAQPGIALVHPSSQDCLRTAWRLYGAILTAVEANELQVLTRRARVSRSRRVAVAAPGLVRAYRARIAAPTTPTRTRSG